MYQVNFNQLMQVSTDKRIITLKLTDEQYRNVDLNNADWMFILEKLDTD